MTSQVFTRRAFVQAGAGALGAGLAPRAFAAPAGAIEKPRLTMGLSLDAASFTNVYVAAKRTWKAQGLDIELTSFRGDAEVSQALAGNSIDFSMQSLDGLINLINAGQPMKAFYAGFYMSDFAWYTQPQVKTWADLKGLTAGVSTYGSLTDQLTRYILRKNGLQPEKDVQIVQVGATTSAMQALRAGRLGLAILSPPFKWMAAEAGFHQLGVQTDIAPQWPKHVFVTRSKFMDENPNTLRAFLRAHVTALRMMRADKPMTVGIMVDRLKWSKPYAERAYEEVMPAYNERGTLPDANMDVFWSIQKLGGTVTEAWPDSKVLDDRFIRTFDQWVT